MKNLELDADGRLDVTRETVKKLLEEQFPQWADLEIVPVVPRGLGNRTFRLGDNMVVRLPSAERYVPAVDREHAWLPYLASKLSIPIPTPLGKGKPSEDYPWPWSVYEWIEGEDAEKLNKQHLPELAASIADFLKEFHSVDTNDGQQLVPHHIVAAHQKDTIRIQESI